MHLLLSDILSRVDHSSPNNRKYVEFEAALGDFLGVDAGEIYTSYVSKAGNSTVRFEQSRRSRSARLLVALLPPFDEQDPNTSVEVLSKYQRERRPGVEFLIFGQGRHGWYPYAVIFSDDTHKPSVLPIIQNQPDVEIIANIPDLGGVQFDKGGKLRFIFDESISHNFHVDYPLVVLRRDRWSDSEYATMFSATLYLDRRTIVELGELKILRRGQRRGATELPAGMFKTLGRDYCSLGQSYSYYDALRRLPEEVHRAILRGFRDVVFNPRILREFENEPGFSQSLARTGLATRALVDAPELFGIRNMIGDREGVRFVFSTNVGGEDFSIPFIFDNSNYLPDRINAIIGYNGTGKTQLLANLALVATGDLQQREEFSDHGEFENSEGTRFSSVIAISYSAFDTFRLPDTLWGSDAKSLLANERMFDSGSVFGYKYCGLRAGYRLGDRPAPTHGILKSIDDISDEFMMALEIAHRKDKRPILHTALEVIGAEPSFCRMGEESISDIRLYDWQSRYGRMSTGHKIVLNIIAQIIAYSEPKSLVLIDEPESHLHPSLLAALVRALNLVLVDLNSYAIVSTHSPVVLQEIPRQYVSIMQRFGSLTTIADPPEETFGENVGLLTTNTFHLESSETDYHSVLERLAAEMHLEQIESLFEEGMSTQARAFVRQAQRQNGWHR